jgi:hypothetical protein
MLPGLVVRVYHLLTTTFHLKKDLALALAGSIPTEVGKLINMQKLYLYENQLTGTPRLLMLPGLVA